MQCVRGFVLLGLVLGVVRFSVADDGQTSLKITLSEAEKPENRRLEVQGLPAESLKLLASLKADDPRLAAWFSVYVGRDPKADQPAMLGTYEVTKTALAFSPRFGFENGRAYTAKLTLSGREAIWQVFELADDSPKEHAAITAVYPTGDELPENLLRIYIHFSAPMSQGRSYQYLHLFDESGEEVEWPFLTLPQELWSLDGKRLTVLLDPGRVKQGLKPREQSGPVLVPQKKYAFTIDADWPDANGTPLSKSFEKSFKTTEADVTQPNPDEWKISLPKPGTKEAVVVTFDEPLDHGMLGRVLSIADAKGKDVPGEIQIDRQETRWRFTPDVAWAPGGYALKIQTHLEDRVGNSIARPFEVDLAGPPLPEVPKVILKRFAIQANGQTSDVGKNE